MLYMNSMKAIKCCGKTPQHFIANTGYFLRKSKNQKLNNSETVRCCSLNQANSSESVKCGLDIEALPFWTNDPSRKFVVFISADFGSH